MIERIYTAKEHSAGQSQVPEIKVVAGKGIVGDRNYGKSSWPGQNITFVEIEEIDEFNKKFGREIDLDATRRNIITRGIQLNDLVGATFRIGDAVLLGVELCEPCSYLGSLLENEQLSKAEVVKYFLSKGGLRADVVTSGTISVGMTLSNA